MFSKIRFVMFILYPWSGFFHAGSGSGSLIQGPKKHRIPDPDPQHWVTIVKLICCKQTFWWEFSCFLPRSTFSLSDKMYSGEEGGSFKRMRFSEDSETTQRRKVSSNEVFECRPLFGFCVFFLKGLSFSPPARSRTTYLFTDTVETKPGNFCLIQISRTFVHWDIGTVPYEDRRITQNFSPPCKWGNIFFHMGDMYMYTCT